MRLIYVPSSKVTINVETIEYILWEAVSGDEKGIRLIFVGNHNLFLTGEGAEHFKREFGMNHGAAPTLD